MNMGKAINFINEKFEANGWKETRFDVPSTNSIIWATPCAQIMGDIEDPSQIEYILIENNDGINVPGFDTIEALAAFLMDYPRRLELERQQQKDCRNYYKTKILDKLAAGETVDEDTWQFYSDYHKDCFGFRPKREV